MQPLLLLHGAIGAADQLESLKQQLNDTYKVYTFNFSGHGGKTFPEQPFSIELFAEEVLRFINEEGLEEVSIFGYSMGGYVAMLLAKQHPEKVKHIVTLATKFHWDEQTAAKETKMLQADVIEAKVPKFAATLAERHAPNDWKEVLKRTAEMLNNMGQNSPLKLEENATIKTPSLILLGDRDKMITLEETINVYKTLPNAQMGMLPNTHHPIEQVNIEALLLYIRQFMK